MENYSAFDNQFNKVYDSLKRNLKVLDDYSSLLGTLKGNMNMGELAQLNKFLGKTNSKLERMTARFKKNISSRVI